MKRRRQTTESEKKSEEETKTEFNPMYVMKIKSNYHIIGDDDDGVVVSLGQVTPRKGRVVASQ